MAITPEDAERQNCIPYDEETVKRIEARIDRHLRNLAGSGTICFSNYLNRLGIVGATEGDLIEVKNRYIKAGWKVECLVIEDENRDSLWISVSEKTVEIEPEKLLNLERMIERRDVVNFNPIGLLVGGA